MEFLLQSDTTEETAAKPNTHVSFTVSLASLPYITSDPVLFTRDQHSLINFYNTVLYLCNLFSPKVLIKN